MIQRMNNVLVKHSKILFGIITIVIIVSFVWFLTPGADGSLFFSHGSGKAGTVFGKDIKIADMETARNNVVLLQAPMYYEHNPAMLRYAASKVDESMMFRFAALLSAAEQKGFAASNEEVKNVIVSIPAFQQDGKFSTARYNEFKEKCLNDMNYTFEDFENAVRCNIILEKFQASCVKGLIVTDDEVNVAVNSLAKKITVRSVKFDVKNFEKGITVTDAEAKVEYDVDPAQYKSLPESDALMVYINAKDVSGVPAVTDAQVDEQYKAFGSMMTGADKKPLPEKTAKAQIRSQLQTEAALSAASAKANKFYLKAHDLTQTEEFKKDPAGELKKAAEAEGFKTAVLTKLTKDSPATLIADKQIIDAVTALSAVNLYTTPLTNKDTIAFALLTKRVEPQQLSFDVAKTQIKSDLLRKKAGAKADEAARALRADVVAKKITADKLDAAVKAAGGVAEEAKTFSKLAEIKKHYTECMAAERLNPYIKQQILGMLKMQVLDDNHDEGFISQPENTGSALEMFYLAKVEKVPGDIDDAAKSAVKELLLLNKQDAAVQQWYAWLEQNTRCYLQLKGNRE